jgi:cytochrome c5
MKTRPLATLRKFLIVAISAAVLISPTLFAAPTSQNSTAPAVQSPKQRSDDAAANQGVKRMKKLTGAELYSMHCNRCHPERYPTERTAAQWKTILMHMRVRANLPAEHARTILKYLQDNSGR